MKISIISDEICLDFEQAVKFGKEWGISDYEIRNLKTGRVPHIAKEELTKVVETIQHFELNVTAISPGLFKISLVDELQLKLQIEEHIYESFRIAEKLGTKNVIIFGFKKCAKEPQTNYIQVIHILGRMASLAEKYGFNLQLENFPGFWADTGTNTAKILADVNSKHLSANWDLANAAVAGEIPYPYGYLAIRNYIQSIHIKDFVSNKNGNPEFAVLGEGSIDWLGQFRAIINGRDVNCLTIETHCQPLIANSLKNFLKITKMLEELERDEQFVVK
jgi:sugar phosphate isomerase/epimerase